MPYADEDGQRKMKIQLEQLENEEQYVNPDFLELSEEEAEQKTFAEYDKFMSFMFG